MSRSGGRAVWRRPRLVAAVPIGAFDAVAVPRIQCLRRIDGHVRGLDIGGVILVSRVFRAQSLIAGTIKLSTVVALRIAAMRAIVKAILLEPFALPLAHREAVGRRVSAYMITARAAVIVVRQRAAGAGRGCFV